MEQELRQEQSSLWYFEIKWNSLLIVLKHIQSVHLWIFMNNILIEKTLLNILDIFCWNKSL